MWPRHERPKQEWLGCVLWVLECNIVREQCMLFSTGKVSSTWFLVRLQIKSRHEGFLP